MIAVIGGSGFIGTRLCNLLSNNNIDFKVIDIKKSQDYPDKYIYGDVTNLESLKTALIDADKIINLAAEHKDNVHPISLYYQVNVQGAKNVCDAAHMLGINHLIFTSSVAVYGFVEKETGEDGEFNPFNDYGKSKLEAEFVYTDWQSKDNSRTLVVIRPTVVFGEKNRGNVYNLFNQIASGNFLMIGSGENKKSMAYVENVSAFISYCTNLEAGQYIYNYVDKPDFTMNQLTSVICSSLGRKPKNIHIPYFIGLLGGKIFDLGSILTKKEFPVSSIRVKKFCAKTQFKSNSIDALSFKAPTTLEQGIVNTVQYEFLNKDAQKY
ncbi:NAD-dependent epimerase/dehydratase family protein [Pectobacterium versatile]|uniref:NAD-dependent epimerase/dehydratase family protein n=1 Tax=Pectobacterium versatile TaxID=2488639 RepID=UPI000C7F09E6|nr:NAD-dependent epimerase/dehydratase family protein [Pectobacterium versatile]MCA6914336.1 NAD-dependent epimerase/dehydratase family protein [Pectobacterium versatile]PLY38641.1 UDP-N-acetylglucosamine 4-epimerase [Pectobacterium carotovorum]